MLIFNHDFDCYCTSKNRPLCLLRAECLLKHLETNFKDVKQRQIRAEVEIVRKTLKEGISRASIDRSVILDSSETTKTFKKR